MKLRYLLLGLLMLTLSACDNAEQAPQETIVIDEVIEVPLTTEEAAAEIEALAESGSTTEEEVAEAPVVVEETIVLTETAPAADQNWKYQEGENFRRMTTSQGTSSPPDKIEVAEVFRYGCPHCYDFDPVLDEWRETLPSDVAFVRIPVVWSPTHQIHARVMYTAEALGKLDEMHTGIFEAIHQRGSQLTSEDELVELFAKYDVSEEQFREAFNSFGVSSSVKRAENLGRRYGVRSVPVLIVNGKYATDAPGNKTYDDIIRVTNELIERERAAR
jgi:thiol:disulfide interchange protein DsbA